MSNFNNSSNNIYLGKIYTSLPGDTWLYINDGAFTIGGEGKIKSIGHRDDVLKRFPDLPVVDCRPYLIVPGFVDCHQHLCHYDWVRLIPNLMDWLEQIYDFEARFKNLKYTTDVAQCFFSSLVRNGTTTVCVHGPYFADATDEAFQVASESGLRVLMGMNAADKNILPILCQSIDVSIENATTLYKKWHGANQGLLSYCFTVRPAYCASRHLMQAVSLTAKQLGAGIQCHLAEDAEGQKAILNEFPFCKTDTEVYKQVGLLNERTLMAHGIYISDSDRIQLADSGTSIIHCPRANLMAGGKQFDLQKAKRSNISVGLGTDLGGAKCISMFRVMEDAIKINSYLSVHDLFQMATLDGAEALKLGDTIGSLEIGKDADFIVLCPKVLEVKSNIFVSEIEDLLSSLVFQGDDRDIKMVVVKGRNIYYRT